MSFWTMMFCCGSTPRISCAVPQQLSRRTFVGFFWKLVTYRVALTPALEGEHCVKHISVCHEGPPLHLGSDRLKVLPIERVESHSGDRLTCRVLVPNGTSEASSDRTVREAAEQN